MDEKIQPQNIESEQSVLGAMMMSKDAVAIVAGKLKAEHFYKNAHANIFKCILSLSKKNEPVDLITVSSELKKANLLEESGGRSYLAEVIDSVPSAANATKYADIVFEKSILRQLIDSGSEIISNAFDDRQEASAILDRAHKALHLFQKKWYLKDLFP